MISIGYINVFLSVNNIKSENDSDTKPHIIEIIIIKWMSTILSQLNKTDS